jgi:hypothetical protein
MKTWQPCDKDILTMGLTAMTAEPLEIWYGDYTVNICVPKPHTWSNFYKLLSGAATDEYNLAKFCT